MQEAAGEAVALCRAALADAEFLNFRPSVLAAALLYAERRGRGALPFWPAALAQLTGYTHAATPELAAAIAAGQRLCERLGLGAPAPPQAPLPPQTPPPAAASPAPAPAWPLSPHSAPVTPRSPWPPRSPQGGPQGGTATWRALRKRLQTPNGACLPGGRPMAGAPPPAQWSPRRACCAGCCEIWPELGAWALCTGIPSVLCFCKAAAVMGTARVFNSCMSSCHRHLLTTKHSTRCRQGVNLTGGRCGAG